MSVILREMSALLNDVADAVVYIPKHMDKLWSFAKNAEGPRSTSWGRSVTEMWNNPNEQEAAVKIAVKAGIIALTTFALLNVLGVSLLLRAAAGVGTLAFMHVYYHHQYEGGLGAQAANFVSSIINKR